MSEKVSRAERARHTLARLRSRQRELENALAYVLEQPEKRCKCRACKTLRALSRELDECRSHK